MSVNPERVTGLSADQLQALVARIKKSKNRAREDSAISPRAAGAARLPLSFAQERFWFLDRLGAGRATYNIPEAVRLTGRLDIAALRLTAEEIVRRHESLRTAFAQGEDGSPYQVVSPAVSLELPLVDLADLPLAAREAELPYLIREEAQRLFDLERGPLVRASLLRIAEAEHVLLLTIHHIVADGWSMGVLVREIGVLYGALSTGRPSPLTALPIQYADYALWQRARFRAEALEVEVSWWREQLAGLPESLDLPADRPRPRTESSRGGRVPLVLGSEPSEALSALALRRGATLFMMLLAGLQALLARYTGQADLAVGTPIANRGRREVADLIGCFLNSLVLRVDAGGDPAFDELLARVRRGTLAAYEHQELPFEKVVEAVQPERVLGRSPLFQILVVLQSAPMPPLVLPGLEITHFPIDSGTAKFDLTVSWVEEQTGLAGSIEYNADLFEAATVERLAGHLTTLLAGAVAAPEACLSELPVLAAAEGRQLLVEWSATGPTPVLDGTEQRLHRLFEAQAARTPEAEALIVGAERLTYAELDRRSNRLARRLRGLGVGAESPVAVLMERSADLVAALLAVLKAGGAYVPLDPAYPRERIALALEDTGAEVVLTRQAMAGPIAALQPPPRHILALGSDDFAGDAGAEAELESGASVDPESLAYVIYTSGSTGRPKGVAIRHGAAVARVAWAARAFTAEDLAGVLASTSVCFDLSVFELFVPLSLGGRVILAANALELPSLPAVGEVTLVNTVPSAMAELVRVGQIPPSVRAVCLAGEPLSRALADAIHGLGTVRALLNLYGPSEDTTYSTETRIEPAGDGAPAIGRPLPGTRAYVVDRSLRPQPAGVPGELLLGGAGLARGYLNRPHTTAERFVPDPFTAAPGERLYCTGDLVRWRPDGELEFLGRIDHQVKIRGFRIEPGELEALLAGHPGVREAAVLALGEGSGRRLVAFFAADTPELGGTLLRQYLESKVPAFMVPSAFVCREALPRTPNGKVDRRALASAMPASGVGEADYIAPRTPVEELVAGLWGEVLGLGSGHSRQIGALDNFFELGGHSLLATRLVARMRDLLSVEIPLARVFALPTVAGLAAAIEEERERASGLRIPPLERSMVGQEAPLSFSQQRLWFMDQLQPGSTFYNTFTAVELDGRLDLGILNRALAEIERRHGSLRTVFMSRGKRPVQMIYPPRPANPPVIDLSTLPEAEWRREAQLAVSQEAGAPFDLAQGPLWRCRVVRWGSERHIVTLALHHIITDAWSNGLLVRELMLLYQAFSEDRPSPLLELPIQYTDFAVWQRSWLQGDVLEAQLAYWREKLADAPAVIRLRSDFPRPAVQSFRGHQQCFEVAAELTEDLQMLARREGGTLFTLLMASFLVLLHHYSREEDLVVGSPISYRNWPEIEGLIGFFVNTLLFRVDLSGDPHFRALLARVRTCALEAFTHQHVPFEKLVEELRPARTLGYNPLFQVGFTFQIAAEEEPMVSGLAMERFPWEVETTQFDLNLSMVSTRRGIHGVLQYSRDLFQEITISWMKEQLLRLLGRIVAEPDLRLSELRDDLEAADRQRWDEIRAELVADKRQSFLNRKRQAVTTDSGRSINVAYRVRRG